MLMSANEFPTLNKLLRKMDESERRRILRPHLETGVSEFDDIILRQNLDAELGRIAQLELLAQASDEEAVAALKGIEAFPSLVRESPAFFQYLNVYLYFGVRFAAGRVAGIVEDGRQAAAPAGPALEPPDCNHPPVGLPSPPSMHTSRFREDTAKFIDLPNGDGFLGKAQIISAAKGFNPDALREWISGLRETELSGKGGKEFTDATLGIAQLFLDDYGPNPLEFELWLRGLNPTVRGQEKEKLFQLVSIGLREWAFSRYEFYHSLELNDEAGEVRCRQLVDFREGEWKEGGWRATNPLAARCGANEIYWLSRILRAEISAAGRVTYKSRSWLWYLAAAEPCGSYYSQKIQKSEDVLREVFGYACDLVRNAVEIVEDGLKRKAGEPFVLSPPATAWRQTYDEELEEIANQRKQRGYHSPEPSKTGDVPLLDSQKEREKQKEREEKKARDEGWSKRVCTGDVVENLVGLAFSGGGIRSATFNLGVLQRLKEVDLLRKVDCLSTVSGGGYIGAWLFGNVRRTHHWLGRLTNWEDSVNHLRSYSNYLAPHNGILSVDTWAIWGTWIRNAVLIQLTAVVWLMFLLAGAQGLERVFKFCGDFHVLSAAVLGLVLVGLTVLICRNFHKAERMTNTWTPRAGAALAWIGAFLAAALFWELVNSWNPEDALAYSKIIWKLGGTLQPQVLLAVLVICMFSIAWCSTRAAEGKAATGHTNRLAVWLDWCSTRVAKAKVATGLGKRLASWLAWCSTRAATIERAFASAAVAAAGVGVMYLAFCGILRLFGEFRLHESIWYAYVSGPPLSLFAVSASVVVFIGLLGRAPLDWTREWWTRFGSVMSIWGVVFMAFGIASVFGPLWVKKLFSLHDSVAWVSVLGWIGTVASGLLAGNDGKSNGRRKPAGSSAAIENIALVGAFTFIVGSVLAVSTLLHNLLALIFMDNPDVDYWAVQYAITEWSNLRWVLGALLLIGLVLSWRIEINVFGLNQFYRNRLVRCYLGATRWMPKMRSPHPFTGFDIGDEIPLDHLRYAHPPAGYNDEPFAGPFPIVNCTLNLGGSSDLAVHTRQSASFTMTPLRCGFYRERGGFAPTPQTEWPDSSKPPKRLEGAFAGGVTLGQAVAVSGAAASPNMGYNTSPLVAFLLTMFNVRLGWWFPNPAGKKWFKPWLNFSVPYLFYELFGLADEDGKFVNVSDGGHFENLGIYELVRRRARVIIAADAECDSELAFGSLGNVIRLCETDFGAKIELDVGSIRKMTDLEQSRAHCAVGKIIYSNGTEGYLIYLKASITGDESAEIEQYRSSHPAFPHQSTADQFFSEDQFESYRRLGYHITDRTFRGAEGLPEMYEIAAKLFNLWTPAGFNSEAFINHSKMLNEIWDKFRAAPGLGILLAELMADKSAPVQSAPLAADEKCMCLELLQLMECVFLDLRLDDFWDHPDNRGWAMLFSRWAKSSRLQAAWDQTRHTFGIRFEYFCHERLGLATDSPVVRA